jgi:Zn-dependent protease with chaperone function
MAITTASLRTTALMVVLSMSVTGLLAQTQIKKPNNRYTPQQDVELGREAAAEVRQQYPVIQDERISRYFDRLGDQLVEAAPAALKESVFQYSFTPVNLKEINAFALPGGPMFINRGLFDAAAAEGEVVGVMAHELAHVLLRHGTANASKAQNPWLQLGQLAGAIGGGVLGGAAGSAIAQGTQFGLGTLMLRYSRDFEKQADLLGAQVMARAGYDPRELARMFETIERESKESGGGGTPQWMSSHPNPGNRTQYITKEAQMLKVGAPPDQNQPVPRPSGQYRAISGGKVFQASVPDNWTSLPSNSSIKVVPQNGYGQVNGQTVFTHGIEFGITKAGTRDLREATNAWLKAVAQSNPELKLAGQQQSIRIDQRSALATPLVNPSPLGGSELIGVYTTFLADGNLFYYLTIVPEKEGQTFQETFRRVGESIRLTEAR